LFLSDLRQCNVPWDNLATTDCVFIRGFCINRFLDLIEVFQFRLQICMRIRGKFYSLLSYFRGILNWWYFGRVWAVWNNFLWCPSFVFNNCGLTVQHTLFFSWPCSSDYSEVVAILSIFTIYPKPEFIPFWCIFVKLRRLFWNNSLRLCLVKQVSILKRLRINKKWGIIRLVSSTLMSSVECA
jgi:hypothetical protein